MQCARPARVRSSCMYDSSRDMSISLALTGKWRRSCGLLRYLAVQGWSVLQDRHSDAPLPGKPLPALRGSDKYSRITRHYRAFAALDVEAALAGVGLLSSHWSRRSGHATPLERNNRQMLLHETQVIRISP